jgi:flagellar protein FliS
MLAFTDPREAYRRSEIDARVEGGADPADLVRLCLEQAIGGLGLAVIAHERKDPAARSKALTRALSAITALEIGVDRSAPLASALLQLYGGARRAILDSVVGFDSAALRLVREDFVDIARALGQGK